jgi:cytochrome c oxidase cbb3-type subunit I/II
MLIAPSWGGMLNGLLTLRGAWDKVRDDILLKFMVVALTAYGMSTFEGPMLSLKNVNVISHFTDWTIAHVHIGGLGWNGMLTFGMLYWLFPKLYRTELYSKKMANQHFWIATLGILLYAVPMYIAGFMQGLMWQDFNPDGTLQNADFLKTVTQLKPYYYLRSLGGLLYLSGAILMFYNLVKTAKSGALLANEAAQTVVTKEQDHNTKGEYWHKVIERKPVQFMILSLLVVAIGGIVEIIPTMIVDANISKIASVKPYTPLELEGRDIYIREGCYNCHSQLVRPLRFETARYGEYSKSGEFVYDHPFQWGSKRTGPDLAREGGNTKIRKSNFWHYEHLMAPKDVSPGSIMPAYTWLREDKLDLSLTPKKIRAMQTLGVPYAKGYDQKAIKDLKAQAHLIAEDIIKTTPKQALIGVNQKSLIKDIEQKEIVAVIAYLQRLGLDITLQPKK